MRIYLISPSPDFGREDQLADSTVGISRKYAVTAAAALVTIAAYFPADFDLRICDEIVEPIDYDDPAETVAISVNVAQAARALKIARRFRDMGKTVIMGGAHVSLASQLFEGAADCLVVGEFEPIAEDFVADLQGGHLKPRYDGGRADLSKSLMPRWDLYPNDRALAGVVQTSRGCPFDCNFCDVIQYLGRVQRHKPIDRVLAEIQVLYDFGYRQINLSDDNFTVYRQRTRDLLTAIAAWNGAEGRGPANFNPQMAIDVARDAGLLAQCNQAGLRYAFIGIETNNSEALKESRKRQNLHVDLVAQCRKIVAAGVTVQAGLMVGFDSDDLGCFERQLEFAMSLPIVSCRLSVLVAPVATPLYDTMKAAGRIIDDPMVDVAAGGGVVTNIQPMQMSREQLAEGADWLRRALSAPQNAIVRFEHYAKTLGPMPDHLSRPRAGIPSARSGPFLELLATMSRDRGARQVIECVNELGFANPLIRPDLMHTLGFYLSTYANLSKSTPLAGDGAFRGASVPA